MSYTRKENETAILADGSEILIPHEEWKKHREKRLKNNLKRKQHHSGYHCPPLQKNQITKETVNQLLLTPKKEKSNWHTLWDIGYFIVSFMFSFFLSLYHAIENFFASFKKKPTPLKSEPVSEIPSNTIEKTNQIPFTNEELKNLYRQANITFNIEDEPLVTERNDMTFVINKASSHEDESLNNSASKNRIPLSRRL